MSKLLDWVDASIDYLLDHWRIGIPLALVALILLCVLLGFAADAQAKVDKVFETEHQCHYVTTTTTGTGFDSNGKFTTMTFTSRTCVANEK